MSDQRAEEFVCAECAATLVTDAELAANLCLRCLWGES